MPKMKTRRSAAKRFKATATGEFKRAKLLEAISWNTSLRPVRETCVKLPWSIRLTMNA